MSATLSEIEINLPNRRRMKQESNDGKLDATTVQLRKIELNERRGISRNETPDDTTESVSEASSNFGRLELGSTYGWSESSSLSESDPADSDFNDTIEAIREEAARIDTIMALDQLDTIKQELASVKKILEARRLEVHDLRELVSLKDDLLCTMELERDLYKAEITKLKDQIESDQVMRGRASQNQESTTLQIEAVQTVNESHPIVLLPEASATTVPSPERDNFVVCERQARVNDDSKPASLRGTGLIDERPILDQIRGTEDNKTCLFVPRALFRKKRRPDCHDETVRELGRLLRAALDSGEELRKRIAIMSAYYEAIIERMQVTLNETHAEKQRMATDLANQIVALDKERRRVVENLERRLRQKERELAAVREVQL